MGISLSSQNDIIDKPSNLKTEMFTPIIISLDGNIGAGKTTLLSRIRAVIPEITVIDEPVNTWTSLKDANGKNLLEHFYEDRKRWAYTFQNCAILTRLRCIENALASYPNSRIFLTERSVLTDRYVFAEMLHSSGDIDELEWQLYLQWYDTFAKKIPMQGVIYITTSSETSKKRIEMRHRSGEEGIDTGYLEMLRKQHESWLENTTLPVLRISTEDDISTEETVQSIRSFIRNITAEKQ